MIDDASTDSTYDKIIENCKGYPCYVFRNEVNKKWIANAVEYLDIWAPIPEDVVVLVDMDDWLVDRLALERLANLYNNGKVWIAYSRFVYTSNNRTSHWIPPYTPEIMSRRLFRKCIWSWTHLRSFRKFLWDNIKKEDLKGPDGDWATSAYDRFVGMPMLEMASKGHIGFIPDVLYAYNDSNPLQVEKINKAKQEDLARYVSKKREYKPLKR
jgi:glycosyltransferase involved in cell wall biosynthesis